MIKLLFFTALGVLLGQQLQIIAYSPEGMKANAVQLARLGYKYGCVEGVKAVSKEKPSMCDSMSKAYGEYLKKVTK